MKAELARELAEALDGSRAEDDPRARLKIERDHRAVNSTIPTHHPRPRWPLIVQIRDAIELDAYAHIEPPDPVQWLICVIAAIGFAFDTYELLMLPLIVRPALGELVHARARHARIQRLGRAAVLRAGGGRRHLRPARRLPDRPPRPPARADLEHPALRVLGACRRLRDQHLTGCSFLRCTTFIGVCVEFVAAVAWLAELFPDPKQRERCSATRRRSGRSAA